MPLSREDQHFLAHCETVKQESHDPDRQVGVVIVNAAGHILATGTNQPPHPIQLKRRESLAAIADDPSWKYFMLEHAERSAINNARALGHPLEGATMYSSLFPCADCARAIAAAGIRRLVSHTPDLGLERNSKWAQHFLYSAKILDLSNVAVELLQPGTSSSLEIS